MFLFFGCGSVFLGGAIILVGLDKFGLCYFIPLSNFPYLRIALDLYQILYSGFIVITVVKCCAGTFIPIVGVFRANYTIPVIIINAVFC